MKKTNTSISKNFILFFLIAVVFWFLTKLSKEYETTINYPISIENLPQDKLVQGKFTNQVGVHVKATGFKILSGRLFPGILKIDAASPNRKSKNSYYILLSQQKSAIQKQMNNGVRIDYFISDSIDLDLGSLSQKKVPVKLHQDITFETGYDISGKISIKPDSILLSGPESLIDTIKFVSTKNFSRKNINNSFNESLGLKSYPHNQNIRYDVSEVRLQANVEKYTEGTQKVSFLVLNVPEDLVINTFPKQVDLTYKVALKDFGQINPSLFLIECDYNLSADNNLSYLVPRLTNQSDLVKNVKISPSKIDFVIEK